jgi:UDP-N-acetylmuramate dehydrogenase
MQPPQTNVALKDYSTMRLGGSAKYLMDITLSSQIGPAIEWAEAQKLPLVMIGGGSNIVWTDAGFPGLVMVNKISGFEIQDQGEQSFVTIGSGESWDSVVRRAVEAGLSGIEALSLIPGTTGATPIQNVGAYGTEISSVLVCVQAYDRAEKKMLVLYKTECGFAYRTSRFKTTDKGRFFITSVTLSLTKTPPFPPFYAPVENYLREHDMKRPTSAQVREAVIAIRSSKLPDPKLIANCGSFFHNPIIPMEQLEELRDQYPTIVYWSLDSEQVKISAGWLLEKLGLKGYREPNTGMAIWDKQALVFVNENAKSTAQLLAFRDAIMAAVQKKFGITLIQEPELISITN